MPLPATVPDPPFNVVRASHAALAVRESRVAAPPIMADEPTSV